MTHRISPGSPEPLGVTPDAQGVNIAVFSAHATAIEFCLFDANGEVEIARLLLPERTGDVFHAHIADVAPGARYGLRAHGPYAPKQGHRFNPAKLLIDPYALQLDRPFTLDAALFGFSGNEPETADRIDPANSARAVPKAIVIDRAALSTPQSSVRVAWPDTIIYELHVRGYTKQHPSIPEDIRGTFAALAHPAAIEHLQKLGVTTVELMPAMAWLDECHLEPLGLHNYWGYNPITLLAPDPRLAPDGWAEIRKATDALHAAGIEVLLDVVFNHSGESDEFGQTLSFRGLDNASYYRLVPGSPERYINDMGCGNCLALEHPALVRLAMDSLRTWMQLGGIDGFRFDLATALGRRESGFDAHAPLLAAIEQDPLLRGAKLIAEPWDVGPGGYQLGQFSAHYGEWNDHFRDDARRYWRGDADVRGALATRLAGSSDLFAAKRRPSRSVNFITAHDGFTLADLVAYERKHNNANGEHGRDGADTNHSWNHGVEGATDDAQINAARRRDQRNLLATLLLARGTPMLSMGAELGLSQGGNNNAYAQDNATAWLDWSSVDTELIDFTARLIRLRAARTALHDDHFLLGSAQDGTAIPDIQWRSAAAPLGDAEAWSHTDPDTLVAVLYTSDDDNENSDRVVIALHRAADEVRIVLPPNRDGFAWYRALDTAVTANDESAHSDSMQIAARSVVVFSEIVASRKSANGQDADQTALNRLADAAGIAADWWDVAGNHHAVGIDTQRSLLASMGLPAQTSADVRDSLDRVALGKQRRLLPMTRVMRIGDTAGLRVAVPASQSPPRGKASVRDESGQIVAQIVNPEFATQLARDPLGLRLRVSELRLPPLDAGRYQVSFDEAAETVCRLTIAPRRCYRPALLDAGAATHPFGLSVQAYSLRREDDFGIGDFTAIGDFAVQAAGAGAATIGIHPLHMLFAQDRERASPYHPSDRRFLDPIYLDLDGLSDLPDFTDISMQWQHDTIRASLTKRTTIDYPIVWMLKSAALEKLFVATQQFARRQPESALAVEFATFVKAGGESLQRFATFQVIAEAHAQAPWWTWPAALRDAASPQIAAFAGAMEHAERVRYHQFLQWLCDRQLAGAAARARDAGLALGLYRDLAVGAAADGCEAWANAHLLARGVSIGAPPDPLAPEGQVWNLPPPNPFSAREQDFISFREAVSANMRHAGLLRIDHVLGLARMFWVPNGGKPADGAYVAYPLDDLMGHLALESHRQQCAVIGEDLGTVPDGLRDTLSANGMLRYQVLLLEREGAKFRPTRGYSQNAVACACTHDLPPLAGWWQGTDIREREALALIGHEESLQQLSSRYEEKHLLIQALNEAGISLHCDLDAPLDADAMAALHVWLAQSPSALLFAQAEDLAFETVGQNLPGTDRERPNWRRRLSMGTPELFASASAQGILAALQRR
jgi:glycogen debranching enzyme GlgX/4-alpha-glucanotransferase